MNEPNPWREALIAEYLKRGGHPADTIDPNMALDWVLCDAAAASHRQLGALAGLAIRAAQKPEDRNDVALIDELMCRIDDYARAKNGLFAQSARAMRAEVEAIARKLAGLG